MNLYKNGLTREQVNELTKEGKTNFRKKVKGKSHLRIIFESFFTFFNVVLYLLALTFLLFQIFYPNGIKYVPITKYGFLFVIFFNAMCSIVSQEASKHTLEKMKLITSPTCLGIRDNKEVNIKLEDIVLGDTLILKAGNEVPCDLIVEEGELLVNESNLTGESKPIIKKVGDMVLSGSYVINGFAYLTAIKVGKDTYIAKLESKISGISKKKSELLTNIHKIIKILIICLVPVVLTVGLKMFYVGESLTGGDHWVFTPSVLTKCAASLVGMIPIGMILLSTITLSTSIVKLYRHQTMVQELYAIENLSRVDTLCLDKTGTLTTQHFLFKNLVKINDFDEKLILSSYMSAMKDTNETGKAVINKFGNAETLTVKKAKLFSSETKYSEVTFENNETYRLGAPEYVLKDEKSKILARQYQKEGYRVLGLASIKKDLGIILLEDELRKGIKDTLNYFNELNIDIKIISGDNALTVKEVAKLAGVLNYDKYISMENVQLSEIKDIVDKYTIFGRTTPDQKQEIIKCLQESGHKVGYIGDGVNDTTSLRQANCSIAMNNGADSAKAVSDVILLDNDFSHLPLVFKEGRRVVSNIMRSVLLFLTKSFFIGIFSFLSVFMSTGLPIEIESIYIYEFISIALCGFLLSIQQTSPEPIKGDFVINVISKSVIFGSLLTISGLLPVIINAIVPQGIEHWTSLIVMNVTISGLCVLLYICYPFKKYTIMVSCVGIGLSVLLSLAFPDVFFNPGYLKQANNLTEQFHLIFKDFFDLSLFKSFHYYEWIMVVVYLIIAPLLLIGLMKLRALVIKNKDKIISFFYKLFKSKKNA